MIESLGPSAKFLTQANIFQSPDNVAKYDKIGEETIRESLGIGQRILSAISNIDQYNPSHLLEKINRDCDNLISSKTTTLRELQNAKKNLELLKKTTQESARIWNGMFGMIFTNAPEQQESANLQALDQNIAKLGKAINIPIAKRLIQSISEENLNTEGIFRLSPNITEEKEIKYQMEYGVDIAKLDQKDPVLKADLLKKTLGEIRPFKSVPMPILTYTARLKNNEEKIKAIKLIISEMPKEEQALLAGLFHLLAKTAQHQTANMMNESNLATVFGPNLFNEKDTSIEGITIPNTLTKFMIHNCKEIFPD